MADQLNRQRVMDSSRLLCFQLGNEEFAIPLSVVREVIAMPEVTPIPFVPSYFMGLINLRGNVLSVMNLGNKLGIKSAQSSDQEKTIVICDFGVTSIGVMVDSVNSVINYNPDEVFDRPDVEGKAKVDYITHVFRRGERVVLILDMKKALSIELKNGSQAGNSISA